MCNDTIYYVNYSVVINDSCSRVVGAGGGGGVGGGGGTV